DRVTGADLDQAGGIVEAGVEAVGRTNRRATGDHSAEVVHAAVARADEALGGGHVAHRAAEVHATRGQRHETVVLVLGLLVDARVARPDVGDRVAGLADPLCGRDHLGHVRVLRKVGRTTDRLPLPRLTLEDRRDREAQRGQCEGGGGHRADAVGPQVHQPAAGHRLALEGAGNVAAGGVLRLRFPVTIWHGASGRWYGD